MALEVYPVVHIQDAEQAQTQVQVALDAGVDGVYLIDHRSALPNKLINVFNEIKASHPDDYIGVNFLQLDSGYQTFAYMKQEHDAGAMPVYPDGLWVDDAEADKELLQELRASDAKLQNVRYLGGTAFKYTTRYTDDPVEAGAEAREMSPYVDVVTTSGAGTNVSPGVAKIAAMKEAIAPQALAVASGISEENIQDYADSLDQILLASSIETEPYSGIFDAEKLEAFVAKVNQLKRSEIDSQP